MRKPRRLKSICASTLKLFLGQVVGARIESEEEEKEATHRQTVKRTDLQAVEGQTWLGQSVQRGGTKRYLKDFPHVLLQSYLIS